MRKVLIGAVFVSLVAATPAAAKIKFAGYEGKDAVAEGQGGTKVTKDGVDFWTTGAPPKKYEILGVLTDDRGTGLFHGEAVGSGKIAKEITKRGGSAAIVLDQDSRAVGAMVSNGVIGVARRNTTQLLVVRYVD